MHKKGKSGEGGPRRNFIDYLLWLWILVTIIIGILFGVFATEVLGWSIELQIQILCVTLCALLAITGYLVTRLKDPIDKYIKKTLEGVIDERATKSAALCACVERIVKSDKTMREFIDKLDKTKNLNKNRMEILYRQIDEITKKWPEEHIVSIGTYLGFASTVYENPGEIRKIYLVNYMQPYEFWFPSFFEVQDVVTDKAFGNYIDNIKILSDNRNIVVERITILDDADFCADGNFLLNGYRNAVTRLGKDRGKEWIECVLGKPELAEIIKDVKDDFFDSLKGNNNVEMEIGTHFGNGQALKLYVRILDLFIQQFHTPQDTQNLNRGVALKYPNAMYIKKSNLASGTYKKFSSHLNKDHGIVEFSDNTKLEVGLETEIASYVLVKVVTDSKDFSPQKWDELVGVIKGKSVTGSGYLEELQNKLNTQPLSE